MTVARKSFGEQRFALKSGTRVLKLAQRRPGHGQRRMNYRGLTPGVTKFRRGLAAVRFGTIDRGKGCHHVMLLTLAFPHIGFGEALILEQNLLPGHSEEQRDLFWPLGGVIRSSA